MANNLTEQLNSAKELYENGNYREALQYFSAIFDDNPNCAEALWYKTACLFKIWHNENILILPNSEKSCELYLNRFGDDCAVLSFLADINFVDGKYNKALTYSKKALVIEPNDDWALTICGESLTQLNCFEDAIKCFDKVIEFNPDNFKAYKNRAYAKLFLDKSLSIALNDYCDAKIKDNTNSSVLDAIAEITLAEGNFEKALLYSNAAVKYAKEQNYSQAYLTRSIINYLLENYEEAIKDFIKGSRIEDYLIEYETKINKYELLGNSEHILNKLNFIKKELKILEIIKNMVDKAEIKRCNFCGDLIEDDMVCVNYQEQCICQECIEQGKNHLKNNWIGFGYITKEATGYYQDDDRMKCSFCNRTKEEVAILFDYYGKYICNGCVGVCEEVLKNNSDFETEYQIAMDFETSICHYCKKEFNNRDIVTSKLGGSICIECINLCQEILAEENTRHKYNQPEVPRCKDENARFCEFCGRSEYDVDKLISGPNHFICNGCVGVCEEVLKNNSDFETEYEIAIDELKKKGSSNARNWFNFRKI